MIPPLRGFLTRIHYFRINEETRKKHEKIYTEELFKMEIF